MLFVRRRVYELFLKLHYLASIALLISLWLHVNRNTFNSTVMAVGSALFLFQRISFYISLLYRNLGSGSSCRASFKRYEQIIRVEITLKRAWESKSGQFLYLCIPRVRSLGLGIFESHPFMVAWDYAGPEGQSTTRKVVLLVQPSTGFTKKLLKDRNNSFAIVDGPYGNNLYSFKDYDTVLFLANGIGLTGILLSIRHLIVAHNNQTARVRRITLHWLLETKGICTLSNNDSANFYRSIRLGERISSRIA